jgi:hypothetical protein
MINVWLIIRDDAKQLINAALNTREEEYQGPVPNKARKIFETMACRAQIQRMFKSPDIGGNAYHLYSLYINSDDKQKAKDAIDYLITEYPNHIIIGGAWRWDGTQISDYPPHSQLIKMMPDVFDEGSQTYIPATELTDINLLFGPSPRDFS